MSYYASEYAEMRHVMDRDPSYSLQVENEMRWSEQESRQTFMNFEANSN